jgi:sulfide dehydrogenase cytochrome subunit
MSAAYIGDTLAAYAAGDRPSAKYTPAGGSESDMQTVAKGLSKADMAAVAEHYAGQAYKPREQGGDAALMAQGKAVFQKRCEKCHSDSGSVAEDDAGLLLGQGKAYLQSQFDAFASGSRHMPKKMAKSFKKVSDADKSAIIEYLGGGKL